MSTGSFASVEDLLLESLLFENLEQEPAPGFLVTHEKADSEAHFGRSLLEVCARVRGLTDDLELTRDPSPGRDVELS